MNLLFSIVTAALLVFVGWFLSMVSLERGVPFLLLLPSLLVMVQMCSRPGRIRPALSTVTVFVILFYFVAPMIQLSGDPQYFVNTMPVKVADIWFANFIAALFCSVFIFVYSRRQRPADPPPYAPEDEDFRLTTNIICALALAMGVWGVMGLDAAALFVDEDKVDDSIFRLLKHKVLFMLPFLALSLKLLERGGKYRWAIIFALLLTVLATKNPIYDRRNALGPIYISLAILFLPSLLQSGRRYFATLLGIMVVGFPAMSLFTHFSARFLTDLDSAQEGAISIIAEHFSEVHYDAWSSLIAVREMVEVAGYRLGEQFLGSILFFVPRSIWASKPIASGYEVGNYLMERYYMWFDNLSTTLPAEGYLDFGIAGVVLFALALAVCCRSFDRNALARGSLEAIVAIYFSIYLMFVLRGSLMPAVAYGVGAYICLKIIPNSLRRFIFFLKGKHLADKKRRDLLRLSSETRTDDPVL